MKGGKGRVYTSYLALLKKMPENAIKLLVVRYPPKIKQEVPNLHLVKELAPSEELFKEHRSNKNWELYVEKFKKELETPKAQKYLSRIVERVNEGETVFLICYEKEHERCHRSVLADHLMQSGVCCSEW